MIKIEELVNEKCCAFGIDDVWKRLDLKEQSAATSMFCDLYFNKGFPFNYAKKAFDGMVRSAAYAKRNNGF